MGKRIAIFVLFLACFRIEAALTLVQREMFQGTGTLTNGSPGTNFSSVVGGLYKRPCGPKLAGDAVGYSADITASATDLNHYGVFTAGAEASSKFALCGWFYFKDLGVNNASIDRLIACVDLFSELRDVLNLHDGTIWAEHSTTKTNFSVAGIQMTNQWIFFMTTFSNVSGALFNFDYYYKTNGGSLTKWCSLTNQDMVWPLSTYKMGQITGGQHFSGRMGSPSVYSWSTSADIVYPSDLIEPTTPTIWYVNPSTGSDTNDGISSVTAWATAAKIANETSKCGFIPANTYAAGDTLVIDTSGAQLDLLGTPLEFLTSGLNIQPASGQTYADLKAWKTLTNASFTATTGTVHVYQITDASTSSVVWEDDKWMAHPLGATLASVTNALDTTAGSFWTDGTTMYVHPFGDTNPTSDGKRYDRSYNLSSALLFSTTMRVSGLKCGKTCLAGKTDNDPLGAYVVGTGTGFGGISRIENCYFYYGSKHILGLVGDAAGSDVTIYNVQCEQGSGYPGVSQSPWVSYMFGASSTNNVHRYINCTTLAWGGLIGSTNGMASNGSCFLNHNNSDGSMQWDLIQFVNCNFPSSDVNLGGPSHAYTLSNSILGTLTDYGTNTTINRCFFQSKAIQQGVTNANLTLLNSIFQPTNRFLGAEFEGIMGQGILTAIGNTFDLSLIPSSDIATRGWIERVGPITLACSNNVLIVPTGTQYTMIRTATNTDTLLMDNNVYLLGSSNYVANAYNGGSAASGTTLAAWQALGFDTHSVSASPCFGPGWRPYAKTPCWNTGAEFGPSTDYTGKLFQSRRTAGAYEYVTSQPTFLMFHR